MTISERNNKLKHFITCLKCEVNGKCCNDNCSTQYDAGNMGEIIENLEAISKALEQEPRKGHWIECMPGGAEEWCYKCSECNFWKYKKTINLSKFNYCPNCGADMREVVEE